MFIGHFAIAFVLTRLLPQVSILVPVIAVSFPDLLGPHLVLAGVEKVGIDKDSPLQKHIAFLKYPYSHTLILTGLLALAVGTVLAAILGTPLAALGFSFRHLLLTGSWMPLPICPTCR